MKSAEGGDSSIGPSRGAETGSALPLSIHHRTSNEDRNMKRSIRAALATAVVASFASGVQAQAPVPGTPSYAPRAQPQGAPPDPVAFAQQNLQSLRDRLAVTSAQAPAWNAFVDAVLNQSRDMQAQMSQMAQAPTSAPDRMDKMASMMRRGADGMASVAQALRRLYGQLDPNQRAIVDQEFSRGPGGAPPPQG
jgi:hypothetical protein